jgi:hypothetical protein
VAEEGLYRIVNNDGEWIQAWEGRKIYYTLGSARGRRTNLNNNTWREGCPFHIERVKNVEWEIVE